MLPKTPDAKLPGGHAAGEAGEIETAFLDAFPLVAFCNSA